MGLGIIFLINATTVLAMAQPPAAAAKGDARAGLSLGAHLLASSAVGSASLTGFGTSVGAGGSLGYELVLSPRHSLRPEGLVSYSAWELRQGRSEQTESSLRFLLGVTYSVHLGRAALWLGGHVGWAHIWSRYRFTGNCVPTCDTDQSGSAEGFAVHAGVGIDLRLTDHVSMGLRLLDYTEALGLGTGFTTSQPYASSFLDFGIQLRVRVPVRSPRR